MLWKQKEARSHCVASIKDGMFGSVNGLVQKTDGYAKKLIPLALTGLDHLFRITIDMFSPPRPLPSLSHMNMPMTLRTFLNINNDDEIESMRIKTKNDRNKK